MPPIDPSRDLREVVLESRVPPDRDGWTLLEFLVERFRYLDAAGWRDRIAAGRVTVAGESPESERLLKRGEVVAYRKEHVEPPAPTDVDVLHDADDLVVVAKPAGLPFHADGAFLYRTLVGVLADRLGPGLRPVQRLDRETSGVCVLARTRRLAGALQEALAVGTKEYDALVRGAWARDHDVIDGPIGPSPDSAIGIRRAVVPPDAPGAQAAHTVCEIRARSATATLVRCRITTGRTHQIRVHLEHRGHPVLGDKLYGRDDADYLGWVQRVKAGGAADEAVDGFGRQLLHAHRIAFTHPRTGCDVAFEAPWPDDFARAVDELGLAGPGLPQG